MIQKLKAEPENCVHFYFQGWRYGVITKRYSDDLVTVRDCTNRRYRIQKRSNGKWAALSNVEFKGQKKLRKKEKTNVKKKRIKIKGKRRFKIGTAKRKLRKIKRIVKAT